MKCDDIVYSNSININFKLDDISKKVAEKLSGVALKERVSKESKMFADNKINAWWYILKDK